MTASQRRPEAEPPHQNPLGYKNDQFGMILGCPLLFLRNPNTLEFHSKPKLAKWQYVAMNIHGVPGVLAFLALSAKDPET